MSYKLYTLDNKFIKETHTCPKYFTGIIYYFDRNKYVAKYWRWNGKLHRTDGPAIEYSYGSPAYWINGKYYSEEQHKHQILLLKIMKLKGLL